MKELVVVSGKGGTGKTSISAALSFLSPHKVMVDCDVDAANFHLVSGAIAREAHRFTAGFEPHIDKQSCTRCDTCTNVCRFGAIIAGSIIDPLNCEGCGVCASNCPKDAIAMQGKPAGQWFVSDTRFGRLIHAELGLAVENSGKLVSKVRQEAKRIAQIDHLPLIIIDGPPGIGCPTVAALSGASLALAVVEPSISGIHDLKRLADLVAHFQVPMAVCINKQTLHPENVHHITTWCHSQNIPILGRIPYSDAFRTAVQTGTTVFEIPDSVVRIHLTELWHNIANQLNLSEQKSGMRSLLQILNIFR